MLSARTGDKLRAISEVARKGRRVKDLRRLMNHPDLWMEAYLHIQGNKGAWLFRIVISASMGADFPMIPHESTLFSRGCKPTFLGVVPCQVPAKASAPQTPWCMPWFVAPQGISGGDSGFKSH